MTPSSTLASARGVSVRVATLADIPALVDMGERFAALPPYCAHLRVSGFEIAKTVRGLLTRPDAQVFVSTADDAITGTIVLILYRHPWSGEAVVSELAWWVEPTAHGAPGLKLLKAAEQWAKDMGALSMQMIAPTVAIGRLYERKGYRSIEVVYQKRLV